MSNDNCKDVVAGKSIFSQVIFNGIDISVDIDHVIEDDFMSICKCRGL